MEYYTETVGHLMMPPPHHDTTKTTVNPHSDGLERITSLGYLTSPLRPRTVWEDWSPRDIAIFEAALMHHGKNFSSIAQNYLVHSNKTTKDVVAFYYVWKKTRHYLEWKRHYQPDDDHDDDVVDKDNNKSSWIVDSNEVSSNHNANGGKSK